MTWDDILNLDAQEDQDISELQDSIGNALSNGEDPGPGVALALIIQMIRKQEIINSVNSLKAYVLGLEARLIESGLRFDEADTSIHG